jgi:hypothetical protein
MEGRYVGGLALTISAPDREAAIYGVRERLEGYRSRIVIGAKPEERFSHLPRVWGTDGFQTKLYPRRSGDVGALSRTGKLFADPASSTDMDAALELVALLRTATPTAAAAASWAAIENVLKSPTDPGAHLAIERVGTLVACSWPRAELGTLAARRSRAGDAVSAALTGLPTLRKKAQHMAGLLASGGGGPWSNDGEKAAAERMTALFADPTKTLRTVAAYTSHTIARLYRERNVVMHGGVLEGQGLRATLRVAEPLIGAAFDRLTNGTYVRSVSPMRLLAQATTEIELANHRTPQQLCDLLE